MTRHTSWAAVDGLRSTLSFIVSLALMGVLAAACCCPRPAGPAPDDKNEILGPTEPVDPGYAVKKVRFKNKGTKPVAAGMNTEFTPDKDGASGFTLHSNSWMEIDPGDEDTRSNTTLAYKRAYKLSFQVRGGPTVAGAVCKHSDITMLDDVGVCECEVLDIMNSGVEGVMVQFRFTYQRLGDPDGYERTTNWKWTEPAFFPNP